MATAVGLHAPAFKRVLVPLDGSPIAEEMLAHLRRFKHAIEEVVLVHVVPSVSLPTGGAPMVQTRLAIQAEHYLMKMHDLAPRHRVRLRVETGVAAERIIDVSRELEVDLLAMTTHSKSGLGSVLFGGTSRQVLQELHIPILLARPGLPQSRSPLERILVPIGSEAGEETLLEPVVRLAKCLHSELTLLRANPVIVSQDPVTGVVLPLPIGSPPEPGPSLEELARTHDGVRTQIVTLQGGVAPTILEQARRMRADLVAMTTHARRGMGRFLSGSFAEDVLKDCGTPVLLQHVERP